MDDITLTNNNPPIYIRPATRALLKTVMSRYEELYGVSILQAELVEEALLEYNRKLVRQLRRKDNSK